jgi:hypothetical protein
MWLNFAGSGLAIAMRAFLLPQPVPVALEAGILFAFLAYSLANPSREYPPREIRLNCASLRLRGASLPMTSAAWAGRDAAAAFN